MLPALLYPESPDNIIHLSLEAEAGLEGGIVMVNRQMCLWCFLEIYSE